MLDGHEWTEAIGAVGIFALLITTITVSIIQVGATRRAKAVLAEKRDLRELTETVSEGNRRVTDQLTGLRNQLDELQVRTAAVERLLKEVE